MPTAPIVIDPFFLLLLAIPVLLVGEHVNRRIGVIGRLNIPAAIVGGLPAAVALLAINSAWGDVVQITATTTNPLWLWILRAQWSLEGIPATAVERPLLIVFFTCIGLNAAWSVARTGSWQLLIFLALAGALALAQNLVGVGLATAAGENPLLGVLCGSVTMIGGFGTAAGFAPEIERAGLANAATLGVAAAAFGVIAGGLIAGPVAARLIRRRLQRDPAERAAHPHLGAPLHDHGLIGDLMALNRHVRSTLAHLLILGVCLKAGAFLSAALEARGLIFPVYIGSMIVAVVLRNLHDLAGGKVISTERTDLIGSVCLAWLLAVIMVNLRLAELASMAGPMLLILSAQVALTAAAAYAVVFRAMGRDYDAAIMTAGVTGFGLGATQNAVASMRVLTQRFGPAPRAFLIVSIVGGFLIDFVNAMLITGFINQVKP